MDGAYKIMHLHRDVYITNNHYTHTHIWSPRIFLSTLHHSLLDAESLEPNRMNLTLSKLSVYPI